MKKIILGAFLLFGFANGAYATDILLSWTAPTAYENGATISEITSYNLHYSIDNVVQESISIDGLETDYTLANVEEGSYTFQISTIASGMESELSDPINIDVLKSKPVKIELTVRVVD